MSPSRFHAEKRNFKRLIMNCPVSFQLPHSPHTRTGTCINLSADGILFQADDKYAIGTKININVTPELDISPSFSAVMKVVRVETASNKEGYYLGGVLDGIR